MHLPYYGVFLADHAQGNTFDFLFSDNICSVFHRVDNSVSQWQLAQTFTTIKTRKELIHGPVLADLGLDVGEDVLLCDNESFFVKPRRVGDAQKFLWSTGETTSHITVNISGTYWLEISKECTIERDSIQVTFSTSPSSFSIGDDEVLCNFEPRLLTVITNAPKSNLTWNDGSHETSYRAQTFGTHWLKIENECGFAADSITFSKPEYTDLKTYNFISPDTGDELNQFFVVDERLVGASITVFNR